MYSNPKKFYTRVVWLLLTSMIWQSFISPLQLLALTNGAKQPEFDSFTPVSTTNMVNTFSGNFSYNIPVLNIPGADGGGYALSLAYDANPAVESQSSWVGLNWTLNPGALDRQLRGLPDDWKGKDVIEYNKTNPNFTVGTTSSVGLEFVSSDNPFGANISLGSTTTFNNYSGFRKTSTAGVSFSIEKGLGAISENKKKKTKTNAVGSLSGGLSISLTGNDVSFNANISVGVALQKTKDGQKVNRPVLNKIKKYLPKIPTSFSTGGIYEMLGHTKTPLAPTITPYTGIAFNYELKGRFGTQFGGVQVGLSGFFNAQWNKKKNTYAGYGYMYNPHKNQYDIDTIMADYYMEKAAPYSMRDNVIGIPFNNADYFNATGEGLIGTFSLRHNQVGHFYPNKANSNLFIVNMGFNVNTNFPAGFGLGADFGVGYQRVASRKWLNETVYNKSFGNNTDNYEYTTGDSLPYFRFKNDLGGNISYSESLGISSATLEKKSNFPGTKKFYPVVDTNLNTSRELGAYTGQSSHIAYVLNSEINDSATAQNNAFEKNSRILDFTTSKRTNIEYADEIAQIKAWNPDGIQYTYGLPSYVEGEKTLSYGIKNGSVLKHNYLIYQDIDEESLENDIVVGEEKKGAYASTFLLTQITTADYVDVSGNGVSEDDFGGYTQFDYRRWAHGDTSYYFRAPYTGLYYNIGRLADGRDDMGMVSDGYKEIYYLNAVETKSHVALFITNKTVASRDFAHLCGGNTALIDSKYDGSGDMRLDALGANDSIEVVGADYNLRAANTIGLKNAKQDLEKLERIVLFAKEDLDQSLVITHFEYDYSAWSNLPNNINGAYPNTSSKPSSGKLTLKKLWFEHEGVRNYKISPYEFGYTYKKKLDFEQEVLDRYPTLFSDWTNFSTAAETPSYNPHAKDMWGYHQYKGEAQKDSLRPWVYQGNYDKDVYDPAAWQLKQIKLPSGGEILVQYEQKDYQKVQDRDPLAMVRLRPISVDDQIGQENKFYLATEDLGLAIGDPALDALATEIRRKYIQNPKNKIYFKFLYALKGYNPQIADGDGEYISGYSSVEDVGVDGTGGLWIRLGKNNSNKEYFDRKNIPRKLCYDYMIYQYNFGDLAAANMRDFEENNINSNSSKTDSRSGAAFALGFKVAGEVVEKVLLNIPFLPTEDAMINSCKSINYPLSYMRIPMNKPKKGGGIRVKRLLMYDKGIEVGAAQLYGTEYTYETIDGKSSGVATNEPATGREENALVEYLQRDMPHGAARELERMFAGDDKKELEAPFGESLLPVPSIGHSRVVVENIFKGKSNAGHSAYEFYTCADYPYDGDYYYGARGRGDDAIKHTEIAGKNNKDHKRQDYMMLPLGVVNYYRNELWVTQGWRFLQNQMHGKPKTEQVFAGVYNQTNAKKASPSIETVYEYYQPGEKVDVLSYDQTAGKYLIDKRHLGMDMDVTMAMQSIKDETFDLNIEFDIDFALYFVVPVISFTIFPSFTYSQQGYSSHLTSKVVNFPAVTKSVTTTKNNVRNKTEYLAFSDLTGAPLITKVTDGYDNIYVKGSGSEKHDGSVYNWSIPAAWFYKDLGQKTATNNAYNQLNVMAGSITSYGDEGNILDSIVNGNELTWTAAPENVLAASAVTFDKGWLGDEPEVLAGYDSPSTGVIAELDSIWRIENTYAYESPISNGTGSVGNEALYNAGMIQDFTMFDWLTPSNSTARKWRWVNGVSKYSPNGYPLEEVNSLGIPSTAKYGYHKFLPVLMAQNAEYTTVGFESFEDETTTSIANSVIAHAGTKSASINDNSSLTIFSELKITDNLLSKERGGLQAKLWAYSPSNIDYTKIELKLGSRTLVPKVVARTGKWTLLAAEILPGNLTSGNTPNLTVENKSGATVYIDDVRIQPQYSEMTVYVYDAKNFKLLASFDNEHFGLYYQYNQEGKLIRKLIETERGLKTIQETQYNGYAKPRND